MPVCDLVFQGGGVKSIGYAGALAALEQSGYTPRLVCGTSAGALVASLVAAGYTGLDLKEILNEVDYTRFRAGRGGVPGAVLRLMTVLGMYRTDYFEKWLRELLHAKKVDVFGDYPPAGDGLCCRCQVVAADITHRTLMVFPRDSSRLGCDYQAFPVAAAVCMSISIPFFYKPYRILDKQGCTHLMVDGGLLSKYPMWVLDHGRGRPAIPVIGMKFTTEQDDLPCPPIHGIKNYSEAVLSTALDGHDNYYSTFSQGDAERTIHISTRIKTSKGEKTIAATDFDLSREQAGALYENGYRAAQDFLRGWSFEAWQTRYR